MNTTLPELAPRLFPKEPPITPPAATKPEPISVGPFQLRPLLAMDLVFLRELNSPYHRSLVQQALPEDQRQPVTFETEDLFEALFLFSISPNTARLLMTSLGPDGFRELASCQVGESLPFKDLPLIGPAIEQHFIQSFRNQN